MSRVVVLSETAEDLEQAWDFHDAQELGVGDYYATSLVADIESLALRPELDSQGAFVARLILLARRTKPA